MKVVHRTISVIELPYAVAIAQRPGRTETRVDSMFDLQNDLMPQVVQVPRVGLLQVDIEVREGIHSSGTARCTPRRAC